MAVISIAAAGAAKNSTEKKASVHTPDLILFKSSNRPPFKVTLIPPVFGYFLQSIAGNFFIQIYKRTVIFDITDIFAVFADYVAVRRQPAYIFTIISKNCRADFVNSAQNIVIGINCQTAGQAAADDRAVTADDVACQIDITGHFVGVVNNDVAFGNFADQTAGLIDDAAVGKRAAENDVVDINDRTVRHYRADDIAAEINNRTMLDQAQVFVRRTTRQNGGNVFVLIVQNVAERIDPAFVVAPDVNNDVFGNDFADDFAVFV